MRKADNLCSKNMLSLRKYHIFTEISIEDVFRNASFKIEDALVNRANIYQPAGARIEPRLKFASVEKL